MLAKELEILSHEYRLGAMHGTAFFFNGLESFDYLTYMMDYIANKKRNVDEYRDGFLEGLTGKYKREYRIMKEVPDEKEADRV